MSMLNKKIDFYGDKLGQNFLSHLKKWGDVNSITENDLIESLSKYCDLNTVVLEINVSLCDQIVNAVKNNISLHWDSKKLKTHDIAYIVKKLLGYRIGIEHVKLSPFPTSTVDLISISYKSNITIDYFKLEKKFINITNPPNIVFIILIISGLSLFDYKLLIPSLIFSWAVWLISFLYIHDSCAHRYFFPKNKIIHNSLKLLIFIFYNWPSTHHYRDDHLKHHIFWKDPQRDPYELSLSKGKIRHLLGLADKSEYTFVNTTSLASETRLEKYQAKLLFSFYLLMIVGFGIKVFFYFYIIPRFMMILLPEVPHIIQHGFTKTADKEKDFLWLLPILGTHGNHISHHTTNREIFGTKKYDWLKWINIHYYIFLLLYKK